jgi:hypothetical protein
MAWVDSITPSGSNAIRLNAAKSGVPSPSSGGCGVDLEFVDEARVQRLLDDACAAHDVDVLVAGGRLRPATALELEYSADQFAAQARAARRPNGAGSPGLEVQRLADAGTFAGLTAAYYALTYVGYAAPCVVSLAAHVASYTALSWCSRSG